MVATSGPCASTQPEGAVSLVVVLAAAMQLEQACEAAIEGLTEYGAEVP